MLIPELLALASAVCIAASGMLISELSGKVDVIRLARWQMLAAVTMMTSLSSPDGAPCSAQADWLAHRPTSPAIIIIFVIIHPFALQHIVRQALVIVRLTINSVFCDGFACVARRKSEDW